MSAAMAGVARQVRRGVTTASGRVFALLCVTYFITYIDRVNLSTLAPLISDELHLSNTELGFALSAFGYSYALFQILGGMAADKFGAKRTLIACGLVWGVATMLTGLAGGLMSLMLARMLLGIGEGATFPAATRAMANWVPAHERGAAQGVTHSAARLANTVTPPLLVLLLAYTGWRGAFVVLGIASLVWVVAWAFYFRDDPRRHPGITAAEIAPLTPYQGTGRDAPAVPWGRLVRAMLPSTLVYFCYNWTFWLFITWLPSFFVKAYGLHISESAFFAFGVFAAGVVGDTLGGVITDRLYRRTGDMQKARRNVIVVSLLGSMVCLVPIMFIHELAVIGVCLSASLFFLELTVGPIWAIPMDLAPAFAGTASGILNTGSAIAGICSPVAFGLITDLTGSYSLPFLGSIGLLLVGAALAWRSLPRHAMDEGLTAAPGGRAVAAG